MLDRKVFSRPFFCSVALTFIKVTKQVFRTAGYFFVQCTYLLFLKKVDKRFASEWSKQEDRKRNWKKVEKVYSERHENTEFKERSRAIEKPEDAATIIHEYVVIIKSKKKNIITLTYQHGTMFKKVTNAKDFLKWLARSVFGDQQFHWRSQL